MITSRYNKNKKNGNTQTTKKLRTLISHVKLSVYHAYQVFFVTRSHFFRARVPSILFQWRYALHSHHTRRAPSHAFTRKITLWDKVDEMYIWFPWILLRISRVLAGYRLHISIIEISFSLYDSYWHVVMQPL